MAFVMDEHFEWFLEQFGEPNTYESVSEETLTHFRGKLPNRLLEYWQEFGFCSFKDGLFFIVNPLEYKDVMETWLEDRGIMEEDTYHVIARTGFGDLLLWGERNGNKYTIKPRRGVIFKKDGDAKRIANGKADDAIEWFFDIVSPSSVDLKDVDTDKYIFEQAVQKFGALEPDEMFTFVPAPFAGGSQDPETVDKVNLFVQLDILAQFSNREIQDIHGLTKLAFGG
jgi:hypothetical protein